MKLEAYIYGIFALIIILMVCFYVISTKLTDELRAYKQITACLMGLPDSINPKLNKRAKQICSNSFDKEDL
jgi:hypothetical protein